MVGGSRVEGENMGTTDEGKGETENVYFSVLGAQLIEVSLTEEDRKERSQVLGKQE